MIAERLKSSIFRILSTAISYFGNLFFNCLTRIDIKFIGLAKWKISNYK